MMLLVHHYTQSHLLSLVFFSPRITIDCNLDLIFQLSEVENPICEAFIQINERKTAKHFSDLLSRRFSEKQMTFFSSNQQIHIW